MNSPSFDRSTQGESQYSVWPFLIRLETRRGETAFKSYVLEDQPSPMPILSLIGSWDDLFSDKKGILNPGDLRDSLPAGNCDKRGRAWERLVQFDMMEVGQNTQSLKMGLRAHGGSSRKSQQKGLRL